jgi:hypothetical protein
LLKFEIAPMRHPGARRKLSHNKNPEVENLLTVSLKHLTVGIQKTEKSEESFNLPKAYFMEL